jgi:ribosomal protein S18 acetylase RimI-like enzyme
MATSPSPPARAAVHIRRADARDVPGIVDVLGRAFLDDPVFAWVIPDDEHRRRTINGFFELFVAAVQGHDEIYTAEDGSGAALWVPPGHPPVAEDFEAELGARAAALAGDYAPRFGELVSVMEAVHPTEPHQYLWFVGVDPSLQGLGVGSALLTRVLERCDRKSAPAYLEATSPDNARLYERHGFDVTRKIDEHGGAPLWAMWREPRAS